MVSFRSVLNPLQRYGEKSIPRIDRMRTKLPKMRKLLFTLTVEELPWGLSCRVFEHPGEVLGVFEAQFFSNLGNGLAAEYEILGTHHDEIADIVFRTLAKGFSYNVAEISW